MTSVQVDHGKAKEVLLEAFRGVCAKDDNVTRSIKQILEGSHKTYKYVLVTGVLAKATSNAVNPITLQAGSLLPGAYDARSLCHKVIVPFEREFLNKVLGGSNEPFLNKPARYPELSHDNAVRRGKDQKTLFLLIEVLSNIKSTTDAREYLACIISELGNQLKVMKDESQDYVLYAPELIEIYEFSLKFIKQSYEGETSAILVGTLESLIHISLKTGFKVVTHKVNQSGASSKEVGDIDVYDGESYSYSIEVKDKSFNRYDLEHAFSKVFNNGGTRAAFIYGIQATFDEVEVYDEVKKFEARQHFILLQDIESFIKSSLFRLSKISTKDFAKILVETADFINAKDTTKHWMRSLFSDLGWN